jgi:uncharacterized protein YjbJ (UPF0337 family)
MNDDVKRGEGAAEELAGAVKKHAGEVIDDEDLEREGAEEQGAGRIKKEAAEVAGKAKEKLGEAVGAAKKAVHSFIHDDKKMAKNQPYRTDTTDPKSDK